MASDQELTRLAGLRGEEAEVLFLQLMLRHHEGGLEMTSAFLRLSDDPGLGKLATGIVASQDYQTRLMTTMLSDRGGSPA